MYKVKSEQDVLRDINKMWDGGSGKSLRKIADHFGKPITYGDIARIIRGQFPIGNVKRAILELAPVCPTCRRKLDHRVRIRGKRDLFSLSIKELRRRFKHRREMK